MNSGVAVTWSLYRLAHRRVFHTRKDCPRLPRGSILLSERFDFAVHDLDHIRVCALCLRRDARGAVVG